MKKKIFIAAAVIIGNTAGAQQYPIIKSDSARNMDEVIITANKFPNKTSLTGKVVTIITREQLDKSGGKELSQILTEQAGLFINGANSNPGKDKSVYLRGAKVDHTLITVDGVPLYDPSGIGSNFDIRLLSVNNIDHIEILKGSQSTLYGSDAIAGVINIITRKCSEKPFAVIGMISYGSYHSLQGNAAVSGNKGKLEYQLNYTYSKTRGINETTDTITSPHNTDKDGYAQNSVYASLGYHPVNNFSIQPYLRFSQLNGKLDQGVFTDELDYTASTGNFQAGINNRIQWGKSMLQVLYNYNVIKRTYIDDSTESRNGFAIYSKGIYTGHEHFADAYFVFPLNKIIKITTGLDFRYSKSGQEYHSVSFYGPYGSKLGRDSLKQNQLGIYGAIHVNTRYGFNAELGGRLNHHSAYGNNAVFNVNPSYLINGQWKLFVNISSAYKTPSLYQLYSDYGNKQLSPETALTYEGGLQYYTKNSNVNARATYFDRRVKNVISFYTNPMTYQSFYINQDKQHDHGIELEASVKLAKRFSMKLFYTYVDGSVTTRNSGKDTSYFNLIRRPKTSIGINLGGQITKQLFISTQLNTTGKRTDITYDALYNPVNIELKPYALWNIYAEYALFKNRLRFFMNLQNVTNTRFTEVYGFNTLGFNATAGARFNF